MTDNAHLSDRMPEVAHRRSTWTVQEEAHLASCSDCRAEWELVAAARELGDAAPALTRPDAVTTVLHRRLAADRSSQIRTRRTWSIGAIAAAAAILIGVLLRPAAPAALAPQVVAGADALVPLPELEGLGTAELDTLLQSIDRPVAGSSALDASTLGEPEDGELDRVFATWEG